MCPPYQSDLTFVPDLFLPYGHTLPTSVAASHFHILMHLSSHPVCIDVTETTFPAVAFFGKQATVFVQLHAEPPPMNFNLQVIYADSLPSDHAVLNVSGVDYAVSLDDPALLTYVYTFEVPEVNNVSAVESAELEFSVVLMHLNDLCGSFFVSKSRIPVTEAPG